MKARVLKNGKIVNVYPKEAADCAGRLKYIEKGKGLSYYEYELDFIDYSDEFDYWEKLKHQYAGMAMQGILSNKELFNTITEGIWPPNRPTYIATRCDEYSTALVNRLKEEEK
jgi:hypothetical protein